ncbi:MAG: hypothetical protein JOZ57_07185, partial [Abitibacteriaceae bacterium]|nr:hypothetical protein [Abditibacteriaceae bacterium]
MTSNALRDFIINELLPTHARSYTGSLEEYLRALLAVVNRYQHAPCSCALLIRILKESFSCEPLPFNSDWLVYTAPPDMDSTQPPSEKLMDEFELLRRTLLFQIADLHRLTARHQINEYAGLGVISPTGHSWYNFDPASLFDCAMSGQEDGALAEFKTAAARDCSWSTLAAI